MRGNRVVITGLGAVSPFGCGVDALCGGISTGASAVTRLPELQKLSGLRTHVGAIVPEFNERAIDRKKRRYMSAMSIYAVLAATEARAQSGLDEESLGSGRTGVSFGSTTGSTRETEQFFTHMIEEKNTEGLKSTHFFKIMNHSCASNVSQALGISGRIIAPSAACATATIAIGLGAETIAGGKQDVMLCGGADEFHRLTAVVFDTLEASSRGFNDCPALTPRPFDQARDGVVCGEGAGALVLESYEHAKARGARMLGEVLGFATLSSPGSIAHPEAHVMAECMRLALDTAAVKATQIDYVNAHATGTQHGDPAECKALEDVLGRDVPVSSLKGHMGHTMGACGALELIASLRMMRDGVLWPTRNLENPDSDCGQLDLLRRNRTAELTTIMKNSFALGGINCVLIIGEAPHD